ncbi:baseplate J/gp47 family protein, partial [Patescibacteria group bacterium]
ELASAAGVEGIKKEDEPKEEDTKSEELEESNVEKVSPAALGFVVGQDVAMEKGKPEFDTKDEEIKHETQAVDAPQANQPIVDQGPLPASQDQGQKKAALGAPLAFLAAIPGQLMGVFKKGTSKVSSAGKVKSGGGGKKILIVGGVTFLILLIGGLVFWWFVPKATVTVYVSPYQLEESVSVYVDPSIESANKEEGILPGKLVSESNSGDKTKSTTGTKTVGERATGEVTLYRAGLLLTVPSGTILTGSGDLTFTMDDGVTIASGSASTPGTSNAKVTAQDIGAQYNLASGESFAVSNFPTSEIEAKNESSFSGGSSREISAVSEEDRDELEEDLKEELVEEIIQEARSSLEEGDFLIEEATKVDITDKEFSNKVGDEASTLKLSLSINAKVLIVKKSDLIEIAQEALKEKVAEGFVLRDDQIDVTFEFIDEDEEIYELKVTFSANLLPEVKPDEVVEKIKGKYPLLAKEFLTDIEGFERAEIVIVPRFPGRLGTLPRINKNITIEVSSQK